MSYNDQIAPGTLPGTSIHMPDQLPHHRRDLHQLTWGETPENLRLVGGKRVAFKAALGEKKHDMQPQRTIGTKKHRKFQGGE